LSCSGWRWPWGYQRRISCGQKQTIVSEYESNVPIKFHHFVEEPAQAEASGDGRWGGGFLTEEAQAQLECNVIVDEFADLLIGIKPLHVIVFGVFDFFVVTWWVGR